MANISNNNQILITDLLKQDECEWIEYKSNLPSSSKNKPEEILGEYISAISNGACLHSKLTGYLILGVDDNKEIVGTKFKVNVKINKQPLLMWLSQRLDPKIDFRIEKAILNGFSMIIVKIPAASTQPTRFNRIARVRVGSTTSELFHYPEKERKIWTNTHPKQYSINTLQQFEYLLDAALWKREHIDHQNVWICQDDNLFQIVEGLEIDDFTESWTTVYPDKMGSSKHSVYLKINNVIIKQLLFVSCDGGRINVVIPNRSYESEEMEYYWYENSLEFKVMRLIGSFYIYNDPYGVARMSGIKIQTSKTR